jgi:hypothetical protein
MIELKVEKSDVNFAHYDYEGYYSLTPVKDYSNEDCLILERLLDEFDTELIVILEKTPENIEKIFGKEIKELYFSQLEKRRILSQLEKRRIQRENRIKNASANAKKGWITRRKNNK